jgi:hypothetical protein
MDPEIDAMSKVAEALGQLDDAAQTRVLKWAADRFNVAIGHKKAANTNDEDNIDTEDDETDESSDQEYETFAELFADAAPSTHAEKVLVAGYWHQVILGQSHITSAPLNKDLKDLGHVVANISEKFDSLKGMKPQLAIQLKKSGNSKQARKQYKITKAGIDKVKEMLGN